MMERKQDLEEIMANCVADLLEQAPFVRRAERATMATGDPLVPETQGCEASVIIQTNLGEVFKIRVELLSPDHPLARTLDDSIPPGEARWFPRGEEH